MKPVRDDVWQNFVAAWLTWSLIKGYILVGVVVGATVGVLATWLVTR